MTTKNIDNKTKKVVNPTVTLSTVGNTNGEIDLQSIQITNVPADAYTVEQTADGVNIVFSDYTLEENITISYNVISQNAGQISAQAVITSNSIDTLSETVRTAISAVDNLQFSAGDSEGIIYKTTAVFETYNTKDPSKNIPNVSISLINKLTNQEQTFTTDETGTYNLADVYTGKYVLYVTQVPEGYAIPEELLTGKEIQFTRNTNDFSIGIEPEKDLRTVTVKDSTLYVGEPWQAEDNFVSATNKAGEPVSLSELVVSGTVDTAQVGSYEVTYQNGDHKATATINVVADQATVVAKDSTLYVGEDWQAEDNFVSATDKTGKPLTLNELEVSGAVDTKTPGIYTITYKNGAAVAQAYVTVKENLASITLVDSILYVGDEWTATDNFVSATNSEGQTIAFENVKVTGAVNTSKIGVYTVDYTITESGSFEKNFVQRLIANENTVTGTATIQVIAKENGKNTEDKENNQNNDDTNKEENKKQPTTALKSKTVHTTTKQSKLPQTGEENHWWLYVLGIGLMGMAVGLFFQKKRKHD